MKDRFKALRHRLVGFLRIDLWNVDSGSMPRWQAFGLRQLRVGVIFVRGLGKSRIQLRASAMTFTTLLTLGPVLILALSVCQAFGVLQGLQSQLETFLLDNLSPASVEQFRVWLHRFFDGVRSGAFRGLSVLVLIGGVAGLLGSIEQAFNDIWGVHRGRPLFQRFAIYTTIVVFGPILIGLSMSLTASLETSVLRVWIASRSAGLEQLLKFGFKFAPALFTGVALTLLYTVMPNVRVRLRASFPAGVMAGVLWELLKFGYRWYMHRASHYGTIYGSLAAVPLFLIWVYVSWLVVLFGAQLAFARDAARDFRLEEGALHATPLERLRVAFHLVLAASRSYRDDREPPELVRLAHRFQLPLRLVRSVAEELADGGILHLVALEQRETGLVPARNPERTTTYDIIACIVRGGAALPPAETGVAPSHLVDKLMGDVDRILKDRCGAISLAEILEEQDHLEQQEVLPFPRLEVRPRVLRDRPDEDRG